MVSLLFIKKEGFSDCNFKCYRGRTKGQCLDICRDPELIQFYEVINNACSESECVKICNECSSSEICHWINPYSQTEENKNEVSKNQ